jgi:hypothetical protein
MQAFVRLRAVRPYLLRHARDCAPCRQRLVPFSAEVRRRRAMLACAAGVLAGLLTWWWTR